ncbi:hypothetical protein PVAND_013688 [Polypedilum vanderplanki]|uniref:N-acetyltransferase domain-containing protein n=1 Tax=Polypedilum vanderplanki TaxID=319348 RepID=A0A9J6CS48_POLVA|nr:hypothetical protein PVAND_013688 [Polypedilum vanderplanki]
MSKFQRPASLATGTVYHTFQAKNKAGDAMIEYQIKDLPEELYEKALEILTADFATEETLCVAKNITANAAAMNEVCYFWHQTMKEKFSVGCFANDGSNELAGVAVMTVWTKGENRSESLKPNQTDTKELLDLLKWVLNQHDVFTKYGVDTYLTEYAMCTRKEFRNRGLATEFIRSRTQQMKLLNVPVTSSAFTVIGTQKAAAKVNHHDGWKISYDELQKKYPTFDFSKRNVDELKIMDFKP